MTSKEFTILTREFAEGTLLPLGFVRQKKLFYIHRAPNILVFLPYFQKDFFSGFYIAVTHDFLVNINEQDGKSTLAPYLEAYPFSISLEYLEDQYNKFNSAIDFEYDTNFLTREVLPTRKNVAPAYSMHDKVRRDELSTKSYIISSLERVTKYGMRLLDEYSPSVSYLSIIRHRNVNDFILNRFKASIEGYFRSNNIKPPKRRLKWYQRLFGE